MSAWAGVSLDSCREWARETYPTLRKYDLIDKTEEYTVKNAAMGWIPKLGISAQATYQSAAANMSEVWSSLGLEDMMKQFGVTIPEMKMNKFQGKVQAEVKQTIWDGGASIAQRKTARAEAEQQRRQTDVEMQALEDRIDGLYFGILMLDEQSKQLAHTEALLDTNLSRVKVLCANEMALQSDVDAVEVERLQVRQKESEIRNSRQAYRLMLSLFCNKDLQSEELVLQEPQGAGHSRPEYAALEAQSKLLDVKEKALWVAAIPKIGAFAQGWYGYPSLDMFKSLTSNDWRLNGLVGVSMSWNIDGFYTIPLNRKKIAVQRQGLGVQRDLLQFNDKLQRTEKASAIARWDESLKDDELIVALRTRVRQAAESKHENGTITTAELLKAITDEQNARITYMLHRISKAKTEYELGKIQ